LIYFIFRDDTYVIGEFTAGVRILLEKGLSRHHISEDQQFSENTQKILFGQKTKVARRRGRGEPPGAHTTPWCGPALGRAAWWRILKTEFHVGEKVLLYRSRLRFFTGKLLSKWEEPFIIEEVYCSGAIKIALLKDNTMQVVNGKILKHYISGDSYNVDIDIIQVAILEEFIK
jgi:hypothetical protein